MVDQNQAGIQNNGQPVMGGNPYDLIDNKNQESSPVVASTNIQTEQTESVVSQPVQAVVSENNQNNQNIPAAVPTQTVQQPVAAQTPAQGQLIQAVKADVEPGGFTKKLIAFIAKLSGQPDPQTGKGSPVAKITEAAPVQGQIPVTGQVAAATKPANPFDSIMGGVTGFLDKVESKVESVSGIDLDAPINKPAASVQGQAPIAGQVAPVQQVSVTAPVQEQQPVAEVAAPIVEPLTPTVDPVKEVVDTDRKEGSNIEKTIKQSKEVAPATPAVEALKTEIDAVEKNEKVAVNPMSESQSIQFGESKPA